MTQEEKKAVIAQYLVGEGVMSKDEVEQHITMYAGQCPEATAAEKGLTTDIDKAYEVVLIKKGASGAPVDPAKTEAITTQPTETISAAEKQAISTTLFNQKSDRTAVSVNSSVESLVLDRPDPHDWIPAGTKGVIEEKVWANIEKKWGDKVVDDDEKTPSRTNYNTLKAAAEAHTAVDVYIGNLNTKAIGYIAMLGSATGTDRTPKQMTREDMMNFLALDAAGFILSSETKPGVRVRLIKQRNDPRKPGHVIPARTVLTDANKKAAIEAKSFQISREVTPEMKEVGLKSALAFKVDTGKMKKNGAGPIYRTVRVTVKATIPTLARKAEFVDVFGTGVPQSNADLSNIPDGKVAKNISAAQQYAIANLRAKMAQPDSFSDVAPLADKLKAFDPVSAGGAAPVMKA